MDAHEPNGVVPEQPEGCSDSTSHHNAAADDVADPSGSPRGRWDGILLVQKDPRATIGDRGGFPQWVLDSIGSLRVGYDVREERSRLWRCTGYDVRYGYYLETVRDGHAADRPRRINVSERALSQNFREARMTEACWRTLERAQQLGRIPVDDEVPGVALDLTVARARLFGFLGWTPDGTLTDRGRRALAWWSTHRESSIGGEVPRRVFEGTP